MWLQLLEIYGERKKEKKNLVLRKYLCRYVSNCFLWPQEVFDYIMYMAKYVIVQFGPSNEVIYMVSTSIQARTCFTNSSIYLFDSSGQ